MPQLDSKYWFSQSFWLILIFLFLYLSLSKFFIPKIKENLDNREKKIKDNLDEAKQLSELAEKKNLDYENEISSAKKEVIKIISESKKQLDKNISKKKEQFEKELEKEIKKAEEEILNLKGKLLPAGYGEYKPWENYDFKIDTLELGNINVEKFNYKTKNDSLYLYQKTYKEFTDWYNKKIEGLK